VWVLGSGATLNHVDPGFFTGKVVVATNFIAGEMGISGATLYTHTHYHGDIPVILEKTPDTVVFAPEGDRGFAGTPADPVDGVVYYPHEPTVFDFVPSWVPGGLMVGSTSLHGSLHLAALMGASTVLLAGADCGFTDGQSNFGPHGVSGDLLTSDPEGWLARWERHLRMVKASLVDAYGVRVMSLNPWVNLNLEGHRFSPSG